MTRFMGEITGVFGDYWVKSARKEVAKMRERFYNGEIIIENDGAVKWVSSGHYLPEECAQMLAYALVEAEDPVFSLVSTERKRKAQDDEFLARYVESRKNAHLSHEERYEMECAFGKGTTVVDALSGEIIEL